MIRITQAVSIRTIRNLLMERVAKRHLTERVGGGQSTSSTGGGGLFDRYRSSSQSSNGGGYLQKKQTHQRVFNVQTSRKHQARLQQMAGLWA